jgi:hypothetical protein
VPPPGDGFTTTIASLPATCVSVSSTATVSCVELTYVVVRAFPLRVTEELTTKPVPLRVTVRAPLPASALVGERLVSVGTGFGATTANERLPLVPPPGAGFVTVTASLPALAMAAAGMAAVTWVDEMYVVVSVVPLKETVAPLTKPIPVTLSVKAAPPAVAELGERDEIVGTGLAATTWKDTELLVPPPGVGFVTVTG